MAKQEKIPTTLEEYAIDVIKTQESKITELEVQVDYYKGELEKQSHLLDLLKKRFYIKCTGENDMYIGFDSTWKRFDDDFSEIELLLFGGEYNEQV